MMGASSQAARAGRDFEQALRLALKHYHEPAWLEEHSLLATPYFLGRQTPADQPLARGRALCQALDEAGRALWGENPPRRRDELEAQLPAILRQPGSRRYSYLVLELRYFRRFFRPRRLSDIWESFLGESRAEFYRDVELAISHLGEALLQQLHPTFRLEAPPPPRLLVGRADLLAEVVARLRAGQAVSLSGPGGIGKTTFAQAVAQAYSSASVFWWTVRPTLHDTLGSLLFALGYFLHQQGASGLWRKLLADGGQLTNLEAALGLARYDLTSLTAPPLLCFDEVDRLRTPEAGPPRPAHTQLLEFMDSLRGLVPRLVLGQRAVLDSDHHLTLTGLSVQDIHAWLRQAGVAADPAESRQLTAYTGGNPRLVQLCLALHRPNAPLSHILEELPQASPLPALFERLWARTSAAEHAALQLLAVFRTPAPAVPLQAHAPGLEQLAARGLVIYDESGGVAVWPALREMLLAGLSAEARQAAHQMAALIRLAHAEYTAAAYHLVQAGDYHLAVQLWFPRRQQEIGRGQAGPALSLFQNISRTTLGRREQEALALIRAELKQLTGDLAGGAAELEAIAWPAASELTIQARLLQGQFLNARGFPDDALTTYEAALAVMARVRNQAARVWVRRGRVHVRQRQLQAAWREARLAQLEAENLQALILAEQGDFAAAEAAHQRALALAQELDHAAGAAQVHYDLAALMAQQGRLEAMTTHTQAALSYYEQIGDRFNQEMTRINLAAGYIQARRYADAVEAAQTALAFFEQAAEPYGQAGAAANLAEAYLELGDLAQAEQYAYYVVQREEPHMSAYAFYTLGQVRLRQGRLTDAEQAIASAARQATQHEDRYLLAYCQRALGETLQRAGRPAESAPCFASALTLFDSLGLPHEVATTRQMMEK